MEHFAAPKDFNFSIRNDYINSGFIKADFDLMTIRERMAFPAGIDQSPTDDKAEQARQNNKQRPIVHECKSSVS